MEAERFSETSVKFYRIARRHISLFSFVLLPDGRHGNDQRSAVRQLIGNDRLQVERDVIEVSVTYTPSRLAKSITLLTCVREERGSILDRVIDYPARSILRVFFQSPEAIWS
jgi:hypothetical protein